MFTYSAPEPWPILISFQQIVGNEAEQTQYQSVVMGKQNLRPRGSQWVPVDSEHLEAQVLAAGICYWIGF